MALQAAHNSASRTGITPGNAVAPASAGTNLYCSETPETPLLD